TITQYSKGAKSYNDVDLASLLLGIIAPPVIVLQGKFSITSHKAQTLQNIGLSPADIADVPDIADFIPDILVVRTPRDADLAIQDDSAARVTCWGRIARGAGIRGTLWMATPPIGVSRQPA